jgi:hypothetical protein
VIGSTCDAHDARLTRRKSVTGLTWDLERPDAVMIFSVVTGVTLSHQPSDLLMHLVDLVRLGLALFNDVRAALAGASAMHSDTSNS